MVEPRERFADRLSQLRVAAGSPSLQALVDHNRTVALDRLRGLLSKAGLSDLLRGKFVRAPRWEVVEAFVDACQVLGQVRPAGLTGDLGLLCDIAQWQRWHTALVEFVQQEGRGGSAGAMRSPVDHVDSMRVVAEYREFASAVHAADLHELVVPSAAIEDRDVVSLDLVQLVIEHQVVRIIGASGTGKTHTARHAAAELTAAGYVVVWLRAGDYGQPDNRQVSDLIRAAVASCTTVEFDALCDSAARVSAGVILIVDGVNECPPSERQVFVEQLTAVFLRYQVRMIVTS